MPENTESNELMQLSDDDILALNIRAVKVDTSIVMVLVMVAAVFGAYYSVVYNPPVSDAIKSTVLLEAQDFIADNTFEAATIRQDEETGELIAERNGNIVATYTPSYGGVILSISDYIDGSPRYDVTFDEERVYN